MKLEIGGGAAHKRRGGDWVNLDKRNDADVVLDLEVLPLPFDDCTVHEVYSSHCLEHLHEPFDLLREVARVCVLGAPVEVRVPHPLSALAMSPDHKCVLAPLAVENSLRHFRADEWPPARFPRRLELVRTEYSPSCYFDRMKRLYPLWTDDDVLQFAPYACHDVRYHFVVIENLP